MDKKKCPCKKGVCSQYELQHLRAPRWDGAPGRQGHRLETSATSPQGWESSLAMETAKSGFPEPFPHTGSSQSHSPNQLWLSSIRREPQRGSRQGCLSPAPPALSRGLKPKPTIPEDGAKPRTCPKPSPRGWGGPNPQGKHHPWQPCPCRRGQCRTCSSSYFSQNLLVKGRQVRYSTQRQFTGYT